MIIHRDMKADDASFVVYSWFESFKESGLSAYMAEDYPRYKDTIKKLLARPAMHVRIACSADDPDVIVAWLAYEGHVLHYVCVKYAFQKKGHAKALLEDCGFHLGTRAAYTHRTKSVDKAALPMGWEFRPSLAMENA